MNIYVSLQSLNSAQTGLEVRKILIQGTQLRPKQYPFTSTRGNLLDLGPGLALSRPSPEIHLYMYGCIQVLILLRYGNPRPQLMNISPTIVYIKTQTRGNLECRFILSFPPPPLIMTISDH